MLTVEDYGWIRRASRDGMSIREIARTFHHSRRKVREVLKEPEPRPYRRAAERQAPVLGPFQGLIDQILADDETAPRKQRHTAAKVYRRLRAEHGYPGSYAPIQRYLKAKRRGQRETYVPLAHDPGRRLEADFGHLWVDFPEGRRRVPCLVTTWSYSGFRFVQALPSERVEAILGGLVDAFHFFGCVAWECWWDNPKTVVKTILRGRERRLHPRYAALASHYRFDPLFCMPASGQEKPYAENSVYDLQRDWGTPVPKASGYEELNEYLRRCCLGLLEHRVSGQAQTIGERFQQERAAALPLSEHPFDPCVSQPAKVDKYQTVRFDGQLYSVPRRWAFATVTVKAYTWRVEVVAGDTVIARHPRAYGEGRPILDPLHYLAVLGRKPAALDHAGVFRTWRLPACFGELRTHFEHHSGPCAGARQYVRILQLLADHPAHRVARAIEECHTAGPLTADLVILKTQHLAARDSPHPPGELPEFDAVRHLSVPQPDLRLFDQLLGSCDRGGPEDVRQRTAAPEGKPEAPEAPEDPGRVPQAGPGSSRRQRHLRPVPAAAD